MHAIPPASLEEVLAEPRYFPVHADLPRDRLVFVETDRDRLASLPFIDGRFPMTSGAPVEVRLSDALDAQRAKPAGSDRFIFHVAFCGSTLLSTLLDSPGRSFGQREPFVLNSIADAFGPQPDSSIAAVLDLVRSLLSRPWRRSERTFCKPSNWANNLIPILTRNPQKIRPLFIALDGPDYLLAMFRGGRERVEYVFRATRHLLWHDPGNLLLWEEASGEPASGLEVAARIGLLSLHLQLDLFRKAMLRGGWTDRNLLSLRQIEDDPGLACMVAARALGLDMACAYNKRLIEKRVKLYAKVPGEPYSRDARSKLDAEVIDEHGRVFDRALAWAARTGLDTEAASILPFVNSNQAA